MLQCCGRERSVSVEHCSPRKEGVCQFWITPENLKARRFDEVEFTADAY
jgi:hypothetical protein